MAAAARWIRELDMENEVLRRAATYLSKAHHVPKVIYPLFRGMAGASRLLRKPVAGWMLGFSEQA